MRFLSLTSSSETDEGFAKYKVFLPELEIEPGTLGPKPNTLYPLGYRFSMVITGIRLGFDPPVEVL